MNQTVAESRIALLAAKYCELKSLIDDAEKEAAIIGKALKEHMEETGESIDIEGLPLLVLKANTTRSYDVKELARSEQWRFVYDRLLDLGILDINKKKLDAHAADIAMKVPCIEGEGEPYVYRKKR